MEYVGKISIDRLRIHAYHGVDEQERIIGNDFEVSLHVLCPMKTAMISDELNGTVNYGELVAVIEAEMAQPSRLLENVAYRICHAIKEQFRTVISGTVTVTKVTPPLRCEVSGISVTYSW